MKCVMNITYSHSLSKPFLCLQTGQTGDVGVDVTGAPDELPVEGAGSAQAALAMSCAAQSDPGAPFFYTLASFQRRHSVL